MSFLTEQPKIETALRYLSSCGLNVDDVWTQFNVALTVHDNAAPTADDLRYTVPIGPREWHHVIEEDYPVLDTSNCYVGWQYELTPGQREWLKGRYGMTPARTVSVENLATWKGTQHPRSLTLRSGEHINPTLRKHTLSSVTITCPGTFFREACALDATRLEARLSVTADDLMELKPDRTAKVPKTVQSLEALMSELESILP